MKKQTHIEKLFDLINGGDDVDAAAEAQEITEELLEALRFFVKWVPELVDEDKDDPVATDIYKRLVSAQKAIAKAEGK